jgi:hypothetical protein
MRCRGRFPRLRIRCGYSAHLCHRPSSHRKGVEPQHSLQAIELLPLPLVKLEGCNRVSQPESRHSRIRLPFAIMAVTDERQEKSIPRGDRNKSELEGIRGASHSIDF